MMVAAIVAAALPEVSPKSSSLSVRVPPSIRCMVHAAIHFVNKAADVTAITILMTSQPVNITFTFISIPTPIRK